VALGWAVVGLCPLPTISHFFQGLLLFVLCVCVGFVFGRFRFGPPARWRTSLFISQVARCVGKRNSFRRFLFIRGSQIVLTYKKRSSPAGGRAKTKTTKNKTNTNTQHKQKQSLEEVGDGRQWAQPNHSPTQGHKEKKQTTSLTGKERP
jgi:hypothetical protein